jgi:hypothetical protein
MTTFALHRATVESFAGKVRQLARYVAADALGPTRHAPADPRDVELEVKASILFDTRLRAHLSAG